MSTQNNTIPSYDNCHEVTCFCKVEYTIFSDYLSKGASAFFVITFIILLLLPLCIFEALPATAAKVMRNESLFYVFDGGLILLATRLVTIFHPYKMFPTLGQKDKQEEQYGLQ
ncbi:hypothetical protein FSST1_012900 [Fusarium sambucinum]